MDLVLLAQDVTWAGRTGDSIHLRELARHLAERGHKIRVIARSNPGDEGERIKGVETHLLQSPMDIAFSFVRLPLVVESLVRLVADRRPDLVYSRSFGDLVEALTVRDLGLPLVLEVNGHALAERELLRRRSFPRPLRRLSVSFARLGFGLANAIVVVTETLRKRLMDEFGVRPEKISVVPNAADTELFRPIGQAEARQKLGLAEDVPVVVFVGTLAPWQGVSSLLRALAEQRALFPRWTLLVVGDGPEGPRLREVAAELDVLDRIRFVGAVPHEAVPWYVAAGDVCVAPLTRERFLSGSSALKIHEYLACARPVVASRIPGLEFVETEGLGKLIPPEDPHLLAEAIAETLAERAWSVAAGLRGHAYVLRRGNWKSVAQAVEGICRNAVPT